MLKNKDQKAQESIKKAQELPAREGTFNPN